VKFAGARTGSGFMNGSPAGSKSRVGPRTLRLSVTVLGSAAVIGSAALAMSFRATTRADHAHVNGRSTLAESPTGRIEYSRGGSGPPVLVVHGAGGGFDQGELLREALIGDGFDWIAPSRFGYLRSSAPEGATYDDQAHAYAWLLDHLGIERVAVVAFSAGGPSALLFAGTTREWSPPTTTSTAASSGASPNASTAPRLVATQ
jgi:2-hydroxy-6-oxonona-2,4-dienedioate hydrolase